MSTIQIHTDAQRCQKTGEVTAKVRLGCKCGCQPEIGALTVKDMFSIGRSERRSQAHLKAIFVPAEDLRGHDLQCSRQIDIEGLNDFFALSDASIR